MRKYLTACLLVLLTTLVQATNYYVDSASGADHNSGTSKESPWKSMERVNKTHFLPGDSLLFACNGVWFGALMPGGSGTESRPIVISSFGAGHMPLIIGKNLSGKGVVCLRNQSYWEISNLEITNSGENYADRRGIEITAHNAGIICHIHLKNLRIHHIMGIPGNDSKAKRTAGIFIAVTDDREIPTRFDDLLIEGCTIYDIVNEGIVLSHEKFETSGYPGDETWEGRKFTRVSIRNNMIYRISKNAMIIRMTEGGVVEHNVCFETATLGTGNTIFSRNARGTVFQYNEGFRNISHDHDGSFYDPDLNSPETIWQYSYSHDNAHGLLWVCTKGKDGDILVRDNLSENDKGFLVYFNYAFDKLEVGRNIFYAGPRVESYLIRENPRNTHRQIIFCENLIVNHSAGFSFEYRPEDVMKEGRNKNNRILTGNHLIGNPLPGNPEQETLAIPSVRRFHRGFHHQPDWLDTLFQSPVLSTSPPDSRPRSSVVVTVNGLSVSASELKMEMYGLRSRMLAGEDKIREKDLRLQALDTIIFRKIQIEWMIKKKLHEARMLQNVTGFCNLENDFRQKNTEKTVIFFGPEYYPLENYYTYLMASAVESLKKVMLDQELKLDENELKSHFLTGDLHRVDQAWVKRGYEYSIRAIKTSLLDRKYQAFFREKARQAKVKLTPEFYSITIQAL
jgi:hypothetical protein